MLCAINSWFTYEDADKRRCISVIIYLHIKARIGSIVKKSRQSLSSTENKSESAQDSSYGSLLPVND